MLHDSEDGKVYVTGGQTKVPVYISGIIKVENAEISVLDNDLGSIDTQKQYAPVLWTSSLLLQLI